MISTGFSVILFEQLNAELMKNPIFTDFRNFLETFSALKQSSSRDESVNVVQRVTILLDVVLWH